MNIKLTIIQYVKEMRKIISSIALLSIFNITLAQQVRSLNDMFGYDVILNNNVKSASGRTLKYEDIPGSPYSNINFANAKVAENYEQAPVRYNNYSDEIEFKKDNKVSVLPKKPPFSRIDIFSPRQTLVLLDTSDDLSGYFFEVVKGKNTLYKKIKTKFIDVVPAANSYASEKPATFKTLDPIYYIQTEKGFIKKPKNQKDILEQFQDKKENLTSFFKSNKIKFDKEEDLIKLVTFLNQN